MTDNHDSGDQLALEQLALEPLAFEPDMRREDERLKTFLQWPVTFLSPEVLAKSGFYYLGRGDEVRCAFCKVEIMRWVEGDDPDKDHQRWAPQCLFLRKNSATGNVPATRTVSEGRDECGICAPPSRMPGPVHAHYASEAARLRSFKDWPRCMGQTPEQLAEAGFFYTGTGDKTKCFYCDGGFKDWKMQDEPWVQHARWFDRCTYVQLMKGREYVNKIVSSEEATATSAEEPLPVTETPATAAAAHKDHVVASASVPERDALDYDLKLCKICYEDERNICFVPCGHVVACAKCALAIDKCPMCRRTHENAIRLYFS